MMLPSKHTPESSYIQSLSSLIRPQIGLPIDGCKIQVNVELANFAIKRHRVGSLLYMATKDSHDLDEKTANIIAKSFQKNTRSILAQKAASQNLEKLFEENEIQFSFLKGAGIADQIYDNPLMRQSTDIDLLISPKSSLSAIQLLNKKGYRHIPFSRRTKKSGKAEHQLLDIQIFKDLVFVDPKFSTIIELHQRLFKIEPKNYTHDFNQAVCFQKKPSLANCHYCLYFILHGAVSSWERLKWLVDLSLLVRKIPAQDRTKLIDLAKTYGCKTAFIASLLFAEEVFEGSLDEGWSLLLGQQHGNDIKALTNVFRTSLMSSAQGQQSMPAKRPFLFDPATALFVNQTSIFDIIWSRVKTSFAVRVF